MKDLRRPTIYSDPCRDPWLTVATGDNVGLVPEAVLALLREHVEPHRPGEGMPILAFARTRANGIAGVAGSVSAAPGGGVEVRVRRAFGRPSGLESFGGAFGRYLAEPGRFDEIPSLSWEPDARDPDEGLLSALRDAGVRAGGEPFAPAR